MNTFQLISLLITLCAVLAYINFRFIKLPAVIGLLVLSLGLSTLLWISNHVFHLELAARLESVVDQMDFSKVLLEIMLSFMLFAGSFHANTASIRKEAKTIAIMAVLGTILKTGVIAAMLWQVTHWMGLSLDFIHCLLFGALIAPTDPIAVLGILNLTKVPERIKSNIIGESLFNDGVGIVIFLTILEIVELGVESFSFGGMITLFVREAFGGILFGALLGYVAFLLLKSIDDYETEILITLAAVMGGYVMSDMLHISGPLAMVVAGLVTGSDNARRRSMSETTELYMDKFWELVDMGLNAILFLLIGLRLVSLQFSGQLVLLGIIGIALMLLARYITIFSLGFIFKKTVNANRKEKLIMVWSGLKGGLSLAMALSIPNSPEKEPLVFITYSIVLFSIIVQGLTIGRVAKKLGL